MKKTILITGATDGIGLATAKSLVELGHTVLLHGRSQVKLDTAKKQLLELASDAHIETYVADLSVIADVKSLAIVVRDNHKQLDVLINNAGVYVVEETVSADGYDVRFMVNTIAPYFLTKELLPLLGRKGRVLNLSSAAQAPIEPSDLIKPSALSDQVVYAQSKLALTMWTRQMAESLGSDGTIIIAVNPASLLGSKMVKEAYGIVGGDLQKGADILVRAALTEDFANASGLYFDNDIGDFVSPHQDALNPEKITSITQKIEEIVTSFE
ncbi:MAG: oxidoreductase [marine bacterium B5-7]|nr:MAG: oxidoreductase [marine bacterium B5-7]